MIRKHFFVVGALCAGLPGRASAETIEVHGCNAGNHPVEAADGDWWCEQDGDFDPGHDQDDDPFDGGSDGDEYSKGGGKKPKTKTKPKKEGGGNPNAGAEAQKKAKCKACKKSADQCTSQATQAVTSCMSTAAGMATKLCTAPSLYGGFTPWGCGTFDIYDGKCAGVEAPWNDKSRWEPGGESTLSNCEESWRLPHPGGSTSTSDESGFSATFHGVGGSSSTTINSTLQLTGQQGFQQACGTVGTQLWAGCVKEQTKCESANDCGGE